MSDQDYGKPEWQQDETAAMAEAVRRIRLAVESGADTLDFSDLTAMEQLPEELALLPGLKRLFAGWRRLDRRMGEAYGRPQIHDIAALHDVAGLTVLNLSGTEIRDVSPLARLTSLTELKLSGTEISDVSPLAGLTALTVLDMSGTEISDVSPLAGLTALTVLDMSGTEISDVSPLAGLTSLTELNLSHTSISDAAPLAGLAALNALDLSHTQISDVAPLAGLAALKSLRLSGTRISDVAPLAVLNALTKLGLSYTQVKDFTPIYGLRLLVDLELSGTVVPAVNFLLNLPEFAAERGRNLSFSYTPAAEVDNRFGMLSGLSGAQCAIQTVQYLKGTHPDFREPLAQKGKVTQAGLAAFSPVALGKVSDRLEVVNPAPPQRVNPVEAAQRVAGLRAQVALIRQEAQNTQCAPALLRRLDAYAEGLQPDLPIWFVIDAAMQMIEGSLDDDYLSHAVDKGLKRGFEAIVTAHHALRPLLMPPTDAEEAALAALPPLNPEIGARDVESMVGEVLEVMAEPEVRDQVGPQLIKTLKAVEDLAISFKHKLEDRPGLLRRVVMPFGGMLAVLSNAATVHGWWLGPTGMTLAARLQPLIERFLQWFQMV